MNRIESAFKNKKAFIPFITAGYPNINKTEDFIYKMVSAGADLIEIGIPFSDPVAEGPVIQESSQKALAAGTNLDNIFDLVKKVRKTVNIPLVFMTYVNPVFKYGYDNFFKQCSLIGIDGIIIPDLPYEEKNEISEYAKKYDIKIVSLIAPTSQQRIEDIAKEAEGFLYVVSSMGVTGVRTEIKTDLKSIVDSVKKVTSVPTAIGFGIHSPEQANKMSKISDGVIVGSAIIKIIKQYGTDADNYIYDYVKSMKDSMNN
ncbi:tryptophan synthase subunit alpha [Candidatus Ruminimicrobiellum ovillum]|uniref:tryptophan synthase subunit alpha n=1 Tax=Candidatus Ruminimicrobiellum ovillum TaxID=1947927 RepID=UPI00355A9DFC